LGGATSLPYPAYGTPVPGVGAGSPAPDLPASLTLEQAIAVGFARSPLLVEARSDVGVEAAQVRLVQAGLLPLVSAGATLTGAHAQAGSNGISSTTTQSGTGTTGGTGGTTGGTGGTTGGTGGTGGTTGGTGGTGTTTGGTTGTTTTTATGAAAGAGLVGSAGFSLDIQQLIYDGGRTAASVNAARRSETALADTYRRQLQTVAYNVAQAYYNYLAAQRTTQVDLEIVREDQVQVDLVSAQVRAGTTARADIATVELPLAQARLAVVRAQGTELGDEASFANVMGLDANVKIQPVDDAPVFTNSQVSSIPIPTYDAALRRAIALRPDYDSSIQTVRQAQYSLKAARLGLFPTLSGVAEAGDDSEGNLNNFRNAQQIGLQLSIPLYDQGVTAANTASARANLDIANAELQNSALGVQLSVKQALTNLVSSRSALDQTQQEYATAIVNVQSTQAQYRAGVTTLPLLLNAQVQLTQALTDQVTAVYTLRQAEQTYLYAVGSNYETSVGNAPLPVRPTPNAMPTGSAPPVDPAATPIPLPTQDVNPLPVATPVATAAPTTSPAAIPSGAPHRRRSGVSRSS
jgi:outer membrane protein TolC